MNFLYSVRRLTVFIIYLHVSFNLKADSQIKTPANAANAARAQSVHASVWRVSACANNVATGCASTLRLHRIFHLGSQECNSCRHPVRTPASVACVASAALRGGGDNDDEIFNDEDESLPPPPPGAGREDAMEDEPETPR